MIAAYEVRRVEVFGNGFLIPVPSHSYVAIPFPISRIINFHSHSQIKFQLPPKIKFQHLIMRNSNVIILASISRSQSRPISHHKAYHNTRHAVYALRRTDFKHLCSTEYAHNVGLGNTVHGLSLATTVH